ncbi:MAG: hypothetical protein KF729_12860 [Sandaracinaceae bacterium]|nr:hypothetical protein [Sandaracinaceae bacterium]
MTKVALVFRTIGERTSERALELAREHIRPDEELVLSDCRPFTEAVARMVAHEYASDLVVAVDADCLILEDLRPFLEADDRPYVDCYVFDRFRGRLHCGVHITRADVMRKMRDVVPPELDPAYVLRPESRLRKLALNALGEIKCFKGFHILHDHLQWRRDVWAKYALRELRSRTPEQRRRLDAAVERWAETDDLELRVAFEGVRWARREVPEDAPPNVLSEVIASLPARGAGELAALGIEELPELSRAEVDAYARAHAERHPPRTERYPVFGLGLSRTGTRSLTSALHTIGIDAIHYPVDEDTFRALETGTLDFRFMGAFDGITDITAAPYYAQLDRRYPDAKFILTVREEEAWLRSCHNHWLGRDPFEVPTSPGRDTHLRIRRFLRAAVYGTYRFEPERFRWVYREHVDAVRRHFAGRPDKLLVMDIAGGDGWEPLCAFLGRPVPQQVFPHKGGVLSQRMLAETDDADD